MVTTKTADLIVPEVMADMISAKIPNKLRFTPLAAIDTTLQGRPGNTITVPKWSYIGAAEDVAEGAAIPLTALAKTSSKMTIKKAGKGIELTDEALLNGYGGITRTCGGDPLRLSSKLLFEIVLPAHAGVIP